MLEDLGVELAEHADGVGGEREHPRQRTEADGGNEDDAPDEIGDRPRRVQGQPHRQADGCRRSRLRRDDAERQRQCRGERRAGDGGGEGLQQRPPPTLPATEVRRDSVAGEDRQRADRILVAGWIEGTRIGEGGRDHREHHRDLDGLAEKATAAVADDRRHLVEVHR
ncbi:MAG: hypothetical protein U1E66_06750 [Rhodospirillales bacterium]